MRKIITVLIAISLIISFTGCRDDISKPVPDMDGITTYAELFDTWWWKMNSNYVYWSVDSPGSEWDEVYEKYMPVFQAYDEECGSIESSSVEIQKAAARDYMDIVKNLHDGHYTLSLRFPDVSVSLSPGLYALLCRSDINPEKAEDIILNGSVSTDPETADKAFIRERLPGIAEHIFKLPIPTGSTPVTAPFSAETAMMRGNLKHYFTEAGYFMTPPDHKTGNENTGNFVLVAGITDDNILYLGFSNFLFQTFLEGNKYGEYNDLVEIMDEVSNRILDPESLAGVIIDIRGNGGGNVMDLHWLWSDFTNVPVDYIQLRTKKDGNRLDYTGWYTQSVMASDSGATKVFDKPIALLVNGRSVSCAEMTTMFFKELRDSHGADVNIIGDQTFGGHGPLSDESLFGTGSFTINEDLENNTYLSFTYTPMAEARCLDGVIRECVGIEPDDTSVEFNLRDFENGKDARLKHAEDWILNR